MARSFKRPFQPSISSYFSRINDTESSFLPANDTNNTILTPSLPPAVQSSLLNVGMRVRKSVPEGYKTKGKLSNNLSIACSDSSPTPNSPTNNAIQTTYRGLVPYCGILKIGDHTPQPLLPREEEVPSPHFVNHNTAAAGDADEAYWSLSLSSIQESYISSDSIFPDLPPPSSTSPTIPPSPSDKKRRREDADDEDLDLESQPVSPRSRPISHTRMPNLNHIRPIALPKTRRKGLLEGCLGAGGGGLGESEMIDVGDFGDAPFFRPEEWGSDWVET